MMDLSAACGSLFRGFPREASKFAELYFKVRSIGSSVHQSRSLLTTEALMTTGLYTDKLAASLSSLAAIQFAEQWLIRFGSIDYLRSIQRGASGDGLTPLIEAKKEGRGFILGCTHIGSFYHALIQAGSLSDDILVVIGNQNYSEKMVERLNNISGVSIKVAGANMKSSLAIARQLRAGGVVATMLDLYVDTTLSISVPFFGRPAATPAGIFQLSMATDAPIFPVCVTTDSDGGKTVEIEPPISDKASVMELATATNARIEAMVRRHASTWGVWSSLPYRWEVAVTRRC